MRVSTLIAACALAVLASLISTSDAQLNVGSPWFCHGIDCPNFKVLNTTDAFDVRGYEAAVWASTTVESYAYALAVPQGFRKLFKYIDGGNEKATKIPMTSPVLVELEPSSGPFCKQNFTVSFFVPFHLQDDPPEPSDPDVFITKTEPFTAYVSESGGFLVDDYSVARMAKTLAEALDAEGIEYDDESFYAAGYDPPFRLTGRHNEIWLKGRQPSADRGAAEQ